jgi:hypothetical protein
VPRTRLKIENRLTEAQVAIANVLASPDLQDALAMYGYTAERIAEGETLCGAAKERYQHKITAYGGLRSAFDALGAAERQAQEIYTRHIKIARVALEDDRGALQALHLAGRRKLSRAGWLVQARHFYAAALADQAIVRKLAEFSITPRMLEEGARQVETVADRHAAQRQQRGVAQDATRARNAALAELDNWMSDFKTIARVALKDRPQLLEQIGVTARV